MRCAWLPVALMLATSALAQTPERFGPNEGRVLEIDKRQQEIMIQHGPLPELSMDPMSMIFKVADPALLDRVREGDRVKFKAGLVDGRFAVIAIDSIKRKRKASP